MESDVQQSPLSPRDAEPRNSLPADAASAPPDAVTAVLPDSANEIITTQPVALEWVGMRGIAMPVSFAACAPRTSTASVGAWVDLADRSVRGIHMSRIYAVLQTLLANAPVDARSLHAVLDAIIESQGQLSTRAQIDIAADLMLLRPALVSQLAGWQNYPIVVRARKVFARIEFEIELRVGYSSTCPSSAALARRAQADALSARFGGGLVPSAEVADWSASFAGSVATAHAQRSEARLRIRVHGSDWPDLVQLINRCEAALGTPLQTAVKRVDEQAFARRNAENLMFCEDAARRLHAAFVGDHEVDDFDIHVAHFESLHAHDAVARASRSGNYCSLVAFD